jgi:hypothetical protein
LTNITDCTERIPDLLSLSKEHRPGRDHLLPTEVLGHRTVVEAYLLDHTPVEGDHPMVAEEVYRHLTGAEEECHSLAEVDHLCHPEPEEEYLSRVEEDHHFHMEAEEVCLSLVEEDHHHLMDQPCQRLRHREVFP